jgi:hypothetical protein
MSFARRHGILVVYLSERCYADPHKMPGSCGGGLENLDYNRILAMLPVGLIGFMLPQVIEEGFYADPPKNKLGNCFQSP